MISIKVEITADTAAEFAKDMAGLAAAFENFAATSDDTSAGTTGETPKPRATRGKGKTATEAAAETNTAGAGPIIEHDAGETAKVDEKVAEKVKAPGIDAVRTAMTTIIEALGDDGPMAAMQLLKEVTGAEKASQVPENKQQAYIDAAAKMVADAK